jgi:regulator of protease activity HflC (stomatin/prohibitin superfamily)
MSRGIVAVVVVGLAATLGSWYTIDQTERDVLLRTGAVIGFAQPEAEHWNGVSPTTMVLGSAVQFVSVK